MSQVDPYADLEEEPTGPSSFALPQRAGSNSFLGLPASAWLAALGGLMSSVRVGSPQMIQQGGGLRPGLAMFPIAEGMETRDKDARNRAAIEGLAAKYGGQGNPEYDAALETMVQDQALGARMLFQAITSRNQRAREDRVDARTQAREQRKTDLIARTGGDVANLLGNIQVPPITSAEPLEPGTEALGGSEAGTGDILKRLPRISKFTQPVSRPRTTDEMVQGIQALPPERRGLAMDKLTTPIEKLREQDVNRLRDAGDAQAAVKALGGSRGLYTASPEELESAALMMQPGTKFGAQLQVIANSRRSGDAKKAAQASKDADADFRRLYLTGQQDLAKSNAEFNQSFKTGQAEQTAAYRESQLGLDRERLQLQRDALNAKIEEWGRRAGERKGKMGVAERKTIEGLAHMDLWHQQASAALEKMRAANLLPTGESGAKVGMAWLRRNVQKPGADALREWQALQPGIIGFDRSILKDVGVQSIKAHAGGMQFFDSPPSYTAALAVLKNMREQLDVAKTMVPVLIGKYQEREGIGPEEPRPGAPAAPPTPGQAPGAAPKRKWELVEPEAGGASGGAAAPAPSPSAGGEPVVAGSGRLSRRDRLYEHARSKGLTDEQIQRQFKLTLVP